jgi:hypothetical protein
MISSLREPMTKKDLRQFATKKDLRLSVVDIKRHFDVVAERLEERIQKIADDVARIAAINTRLS